MKKRGRVLLGIALWCLAFVHIYPLALILISALKHPESMYDNPGGLPKVITLENFRLVINRMHYGRSLFNTFLITFFSVFFTVILTAMAAYAIQRQWKHKMFRGLYLLFMAGLIVPFQMTMIPLFKMMSLFRLFNTYQGMVLVNIALGAPFSTFVFTGFVSGIPKELEEAAYVDGAGIYRTFFQIVLPVMKPAAATVVIINSFNFWNDFLPPMLFLTKTQMQTLVPRLASYIGEYSTNWSAIFAGVFLIVYPVLILYILMQKYIIKGMTAGAVKG